MRGVRKLTTVGLATLGVLVTGAFFMSLAPSAFAATGYGFTGQFGGPCTGPGGACEPGQFKEPSGVAVNDETKDVYVVDRGNKRVDEFTEEGVFIKDFAPPGGFSSPEAIAVDNSGNLLDPSKGDIYVTDNGHNVVDKFSASGAYEGQLTGACENVGEAAPCSESTSKAVIPFGTLEGVGVDADGMLWVDQRGGKFESGEIDAFSDAEPNVFLSSRDSQANSKGSGGGPDPGFAVDSEDSLYVIWGGEVAYAAKLNSAGEVLDSTLGSESYVVGLAVDLSNNDVYMDSRESRTRSFVTELSSTASEIERFGEGHLGSVSGIGVDSASGAVYVADVANDDVVTFRMGARPTMPHTEAPEEITSTSATLRGELLGGETDYYFAYNNNGSCTGGLKTPLVAATGNPVKVSAYVTGIEPGATYSVCIVAKNTFGEETGSQESFPTLAAAPEVIGESAANVTPSEGVLEARINPNNQETTYSFEYSKEGKSGAGEELEGEIEVIPGESAISGFSLEGQPVSVPLKLNTGKTYYYRVVATNANDEKTTGKIQAYTKLPIVEDEKVSDLTSTSAVLEAAINPTFEITEYVFEYATGEHGKELLEEGKGTVVPGGTGVVEENFAPIEPNRVPVVTVAVIALQPGQIYYYRVAAENATSSFEGNANKGKPIDGNSEELKTPGVPVATTGEAQSITRTSATLSGEVDPEGAETTYSFQYISEAAYQTALAKHVADPYTGGETTAPVSAGSGEAAVAAGPTAANGMRPGETYRYRLVATNRFGVQGVGEEHTLTTTSATPPGVSTGGVSGVSQNSATLSGTVTTNGLQTSYGFEIGTESGVYGPATGLGSVGGALTEEVDVTLGELQPGTTYYYRVTATNADGTAQGQPASFATPGFPTLLVAAQSLPVIASPNVAFPAEEPSSGSTTRVSSGKGKLAKALQACKRDRSKGKRSRCEKQARSRYGAKKKKKR